MAMQVLSETQSRILIGLLLDRASSSAGIQRITGISASTWNKEKRLLENNGLIDSRSAKNFTNNGVARKVEFKLTPRGKLVAQILLLISELIS